MPHAPPVRQHRLVFVGLLAAACCSLPQSCSLHAHSRSFPLACRMQARCSSSKCLALVVAGREGNGACVESAIDWRGAPVCACTCQWPTATGLCRPGRLRVQRCPTVGAHPASQCCGLACACERERKRAVLVRGAHVAASGSCVPGHGVARRVRSAVRSACSCV